MKIKLLLVGKTSDTRIESLIGDYIKRLSHYIYFEIDVILYAKKNKKVSIEEQKIKEGELILSKVSTSDLLILLDEKGKEFSSVNFSKNIQKYMNSGVKQVIFVVGGAYGFSKSVYDKANSKISLSQMTFSHQMIRLFFVEQLYRAFTILKNEPYHHR